MSYFKVTNSRPGYNQISGLFGSQYETGKLGQVGCQRPNTTNLQLRLNDSAFGYSLIAVQKKPSRQSDQKNDFQDF